jgi:hypothetical protein
MHKTSLLLKVESPWRTKHMQGLYDNVKVPFQISWGHMAHLAHNIQAMGQSSGKKKKVKSCQAQVPHTSNPSYSGGGDQEECSSKPAPGQIVLETLS